MNKGLLVGIAALASVLVLPAPGAAQTAGATWTADVGPIMSQKCMNCHRPGQIGPMPELCNPS